MREAGVSTEQVILRKRYLPPEESFGINVTNRAGMVTISELHVAALKEPLRQPCYYPHYRMMIDHNGDVLLCPHDWGKKLVVGNVAKEHLIAIWTGKLLTQVRKRLGAADRRAPPCNVCDVPGTFQGGEHFKAWEEFYATNSDPCPIHGSVASR